MSCYRPILAVDYGLNPLNNKHIVKLLPKRVDMNLDTLRQKYGDSLLLLPCGHCIGCVKDYRASWSVRILLEASLYEKNSFITLTYDNDHLPSDNRPHREEIAKFMKRLREALDIKIRVFYCGESGSKNGRAHYHAIIFGYDFPDKKILSRTESGSLIYRSELLEKLWPFGISSIGDVDPGSACYVAQYANKKKLSGQNDGSFVGMSRRPGLGCVNFDLKWFKSDTIYCALGAASIPRFYHKLLEGLDPSFYQSWKESRKKRCSQRIGSQYLRGMREEENYLYDEKIELSKYLKKTRCYL